jgi:hypothetical protein
MLHQDQTKEVVANVVVVEVEIEVVEEVNVVLQVADGTGLVVVKIGSVAVVDLVLILMNAITTGVTVVNMMMVMIDERLLLLAVVVIEVVHQVSMMTDTVHAVVVVVPVVGTTVRLAQVVMAAVMILLPLLPLLLVIPKHLPMILILNPMAIHKVAVGTPVVILDLVVAEVGTGVLSPRIKIDIMIILPPIVEPVVMRANKDEVMMAMERLTLITVAAVVATVVVVDMEDNMGLMVVAKSDLLF